MNKAMKLIMERIAEILANTNVISFTIAGYTYMETKLVLHFHDCDQVYIFCRINDDTMSESESFFSADRPIDAQSIAFSKLHGSVKKETEIKI